MTDELSHDPRVLPATGRVRLRTKDQYVRLELWVPKDNPSPFQRFEIDQQLPMKVVSEMVRKMFEVLQSDKS